MHMDFNRYDNPNIPEDVKRSQTADNVCVKCRWSACGSVSVWCSHPLAQKWSPEKGFRNADADDARKLGQQCGPLGRLWEQPTPSDRFWDVQRFGWGFLLLLVLALVYLLK